MPLEIARDDQLLELAVRGVQHDRGRRLVDLARLDAHQPVLHHVDAADAVRAGDRFERFDQLDERHLDAVGAHRHAALELDFDVGRLVGTVLRRPRQRVDVVGRLLPGILEHAALDRAAPQIGVDAVTGSRSSPAWECCGPARIRSPRPAHAPVARRRNQLQRRIERADRDVEADLIVALAGAAVRDASAPSIRAISTRCLRDQRTPERGGQRVARPRRSHGLQRRQDVVARELLAQRR